MWWEVSAFPMRYWVGKFTKPPTESNDLASVRLLPQMLQPSISCFTQWLQEGHLMRPLSIFVTLLNAFPQTFQAHSVSTTHPPQVYEPLPNWTTYQGNKFFAAPFTQSAIFPNKNPPQKWRTSNLPEYSQNNLKW